MINKVSFCVFAGPKGSPDTHRSPYHALPNHTPNHHYYDNSRPHDNGSMVVYHRYPMIYSNPTLTSPHSSYQGNASSDMINIALLESSEVSSLQGSEFSSLESSTALVAGDQRPLLGSPPPVTSGTMPPVLTPRSKPPPKPPRLQSYVNQSSTCSPTPSLRSTGSDSFKSSLADVTNALDLSIQSVDTGAMVGARMGPPRGFRNKVYQIMAQARDFLVCELKPEVILPYLVEKEAIDRRTAHQLLEQCDSKLALSEQVMDAVTQQGPHEFKVFCDALRYVQKEGYLADLLHVLDSLIETMAVSSAAGLKTDPGYDSMEGHLNGASCLQCSTCAGNNNDDDLLGESPSFDIDMSYLDIVTGETKALHNVNTIKIDRPLTPRGFDKSFSFNEEDADRYIPVISVSLFHQCLCKESLESISRILEKYTCVKELSISKCHLASSWTAILGRALGRNRSLSKLEIRFNSLDEEEVKALAEGLKSNVTLKFLNLGGTELSGPACSALVPGLAAMPLLAELDVGFNDLQDIGCKAIASYLSSNTILRKLRMRDNYITWFGCKALFRALKKNFRLSVLDLSSNKIGNSAMVNVAEMLLSNRTLRELNLENCNISEEGCIALSRALKTNTNLKVLDLSMNPIRDSGIRGLSDGIKYNHVLDTLCLNMCKVGNKGFLEVLEALRYNTTMTTLKLCYNDIGRNVPSSPTPRRPNGATAGPSEDDTPPIDMVYEHLCQILQFNKNLKVLLWGNRLDGPGDSD